MKPPDLALISDAQIQSEWARRLSARRQVRSGGRNGGRPAKPTACPRCGAVCAGVKLAREHCRVRVTGHPPLGKRNLYVDALDGLDTNSGLAPSDALRTLSAALERKREGDTIQLLRH